MKIQLFHAGDGDCLLLTASRSDANGADRSHHILVDGGRKGAFRDNARDDVYAIGEIDLVYVSHIDDDHISAVVGMTEDMVEWRVHERREANGVPTKRPAFPVPPKVNEIWHNSLFELVGSDAEPHIPGALSATAGLLASSPGEDSRDLASRLDNLATGEESSMELSRRISSKQLGIKRNRPRNTAMTTAGSGRRRVGPFAIWILGPTQTALDELQVKWADWLRNNRAAMRTLQAEMLEDEEDLSEFTAASVARPHLAAALGDGSITEPNLASLMLLVRDDDGVTALLTGDGSSEDLITGLEGHNKFDRNGHLHVNVLKVQHHGATANVTEEFVDRVTADNYVFCGNGAHHNPERDVVEALAHARLGVDRAAVGPDRDFKFWFSSSGGSPGLSDSREEHMRMIEALVRGIRDTHDPNGRFAVDFLARGNRTIEIDPAAP